MRLFLDTFVGLFITTLVEGIDHVYPEPPERMALKRPIFTTGSVEAGFTLDEELKLFSLVQVDEKSDHVVALGILLHSNQTLANVVS